MDRLRPAASGAGRGARPLLLTLLLVWTGCGETRHGSPPRLLGGLHGGEVPASLHGLHGWPVLTRLRVAAAGAFPPRRLRSCVRQVGPALLGPKEPVVERVGVTGASLTFRGRPGGWIRGCDAGALPTESRAAWCGGAVGRTRRDDILLDPRLELSCRARSGLPLAFAWINPVRGARYVTIEGPGYTEIYATAGRLPVRVTTHKVLVEGSSAVFRVAQYAADGRSLSSEVLRAVVAG